MLARLRSDVQCILERDPAARSTWEVITCYPGLHAIWLHRPAHWCWTNGFKWLGRFISHFARWFTEIGDGCTIYQGVTLGGTSLYKGTKRHPTLGKNVVVSAGAKVLGGFEVGDGAKIGSNAVVIKPVPAGATAVGIPARIIPSKEGQSADVTEPHKPEEAKFSAYGVTSLQDDPLTQAMRGLINSAATQEHQIALLWQAIEKLSRSTPQSGGCVPDEAVRCEQFQAAKLNDIIGK